MVGLRSTVTRFLGDLNTVCYTRQTTKVGFCEGTSTKSNETLLASEPYYPKPAARGGKYPWIYDVDGRLRNQADDE